MRVENGKPVVSVVDQVRDDGELKQRSGNGETSRDTGDICET